MSLSGAASSLVAAMASLRNRAHGEAGSFTVTAVNATLSPSTQKLMPNGDGAVGHAGAGESPLAMTAAAAMRSTPAITAIAGGARAPALSQVPLQWPAPMGDGAHGSAHAGADGLRPPWQTQRAQSDAAAINSVSMLASHDGHTPSSQEAATQPAQLPSTGACVPDGAHGSGVVLRKNKNPNRRALPPPGASSPRAASAEGQPECA